MITMDLPVEAQMQTERIARAQSALQSGEMAVFPLGGLAWSVASKGKRYTVTHAGLTWACTCPDFTDRCQRFGLLCKHIAAVQINEVGQIEVEIQRMSVMEETMNQSMPAGAEPAVNLNGKLNGKPIQDLSALVEMNPTELLIDRLRQPLDMSRVKRRQSPGMGSVPYLEGFDVIEAANELFQFRWSFDLLSAPNVMRWEKVITSYDSQARKKVPQVDGDGRVLTETSGIVYISGRVTVELDGQICQHADVGRCIFNGDTPEALDMAIAGAATDCLKRCFRQLGEQFGLSLYDKEVARTAGLENNSSSTKRKGVSGQTTAAPSPTSPTAYQDGSVVDTGNPAEMSAFQAFTSAHNGLAPASREMLRTWAAGNNGKK